MAGIGGTEQQTQKSNIACSQASRPQSGAGKLAESCKTRLD